MIGFLLCTTSWSFSTFRNDMTVPIKFLLLLGNKVAIFFTLVALNFAHILTLWFAPSGICNCELENLRFLFRSRQAQLIR